MSGGKFSPGPWEVLDGRRVGVTLPSRVEGCGFDSHCIALTHSDRDDINAEANARLIAAAPCLLEALREAVRSEVKGRALLAKCEAAIAKATGEGA